MASTSTHAERSIPRRRIFDLWSQTQSNNRVNVISDFFLTFYGVNSVNSSLRKTLTTFSKKICEQIRSRWALKGRNKNAFLQHYNNWLDEPVTLPTALRDAQKHKPGRPVKEFATSSDRTRKRKLHGLITNYSPEHLALAAECSVRSSGKRDAAKMIQESLASPKRPSRYKKAMQQAAITPQPYSPDEALAFFMNSKLNVAQYKTMHREAKERGYDLYPSYKKVLDAKQNCYPALEKMTVTDESVEIKLQSLMNHTASRLCVVQEEVLQQSEYSEFTLLCKWGCDGSSGHSLYKQKFSNENTKTDEYLISIAMVPIRMFATENEQTIVWQNPRPSSPRFCRPVKLLYKQENTEVLQAECSKISEEIRTLDSFTIILDGKQVIIKYTMYMTMVDTKVCNALTETTSTQRCYICGATSKEMNSEAVLDNRETNKDNLNFGISSLHAYIRSMEWLLHISYRLEMKTWQMRGAENKSRFAAKKKIVHDLFLARTGMHIDEPKQTSGNTNDGNAARRFFKQYKLTSELTGVNEELIKKMSFLLRAISSGHEIDTVKFESLCKETRDLYLREYNWYPMPVTVHKIFYHSTEIIRNFIVPIGQMSEEALESRNKEVRKVREHHTRKTSRVATNMDLMKYLFVSSDPKISTLRKNSKKITEPFPAEVIDLLRAPNT